MYRVSAALKAYEARPEGRAASVSAGGKLRIYCLQQRHNLSDPGAKEALYDIQSMCVFAGLELRRDAIQRRDPEMRSSKKGNPWLFGMKAHIGVDAKSGLVHGGHDDGQRARRQGDGQSHPRGRSDDRAVYGDKGYASDAKQRAAEDAGVLWAVRSKPNPGAR